MNDYVDDKVFEYTRKEEIWNSITHGIGIIFALYILVSLVIETALMGQAIKIISVLIYGTSLLLMYISSTCYHSLKKYKLKVLFKKLDHVSIFLLIAGCYTPFMLVNIRGQVGYSVLGVAWGIAIIGTVFKIFSKKSAIKLSLFLYLGMGWLAVVIWKQMVDGLPPGTMNYIVAGGLAYTFGTIFYVLKKIPYHHMVWHLFVLLGSFLHFYAVKLAMGV